ncbi:MAG: hypothetical protein QOI66_30 [Myxococcales bacterium]|jgi:hypothetical protein|nr:hypothetical protein [Myxococcales bacterium]
MAAWHHYSYWDFRMYQLYRQYVTINAPLFRGRPDLDCADISMNLMIEFAAAKVLPVTVWDNDKVRYISRAARQTPTSKWANHRNQLQTIVVIRSRRDIRHGGLVLVSTFCGANRHESLARCAPAQGRARGPPRVLSLDAYVPGSRTSAGDKGAVMVSLSAPDAGDEGT